jgi:serine/threonine-protein kinase RIO1
MKPFKSKELVFNHGDLSTYNVIVNPVTLKVKAVID